MFNLQTVTMFDLLYRKRLRQDVETWVENGWIDRSAAGHILSFSEENDGRSRLPLVLYGIGVVCIALALAAFIAANWDGIGRNTKLAGIGISVAGSHMLAAWAAARKHKGIADLATAFATLVFVGGIALVGQIFHLPSDWPAGAFLVALGALAAAWIAGSKGSLIIAACALIAWQTGRSAIPAIATPESILGLLLTVAVLLHPVAFPNRLSRWAALSLLIVTFGRWLTDSTGILDGSHDADFAAALLGFGTLAALMAQFGQICDLFVKWSSSYPNRSHGNWLMMASAQDVGFALLTLALVLCLIATPDLATVDVAVALHLPAVWLPLTLSSALALTGLLLAFKTGKALVFFGGILLAVFAMAISIALQSTLISAALILAALIGLSLIGTLYNQAFWTLCSYAGLAGAVLWLLEVTVGSLLGQSVFFLVAGVVLLLLAYAVTRLLRRRSAQAVAKEVTP